MLILTVLAPVYVIAAHADNIGRLRAGTERRIGGTAAEGR
jgi:hypothetical protein